MLDNTLALTGQNGAELQAAILKFLEGAEAQLSVQQSALAPKEQGAVNLANSGNESRDGPLTQLAQLATQASLTGASALRRLAPFGLQMVVSAAAYSAGLGLFQLLGYGLRVSCNTRVLGSCLGCLGVGFSSAFAGHVSRHVQRQLDAGGPMALLRVPPWQDFDPEEAALDAIVGLACFKTWRGEFRRVMPSNLNQPGAWAVHSIAVEGDLESTGARYAAGADRAQLGAFFKKDGCHQCGSKVGSVIGDHIPPTKLYQQMLVDAKAAGAAVVPPWRRAVNQVSSMLLGNPWYGAPVARQRWYPQCKLCCQRQSTVVRNASMPLLMHWRPWHLPPPGFVPGLLVGLRPTPACGGGPTRPPSRPPSVKAAAKASNRNQAGPGGRNLSWWTSVALAASHEVGSTQQVWVDEVDGGYAGLRQSGLWAWAKRMDEAPGLDVWTSVDTEQQPPQQQPQPVLQLAYVEEEDTPSAHTATSNSYLLTSSPTAVHSVNTSLGSDELPKAPHTTPVQDEVGHAAQLAALRADRWRWLEGAQPKVKSSAISPWDTHTLQLSTGSLQQQQQQQAPLGSGIGGAAAGLAGPVGHAAPTAVPGVHSGYSLRQSLGGGAYSDTQAVHHVPGMGFAVSGAPSEASIQHQLGRASPVGYPGPATGHGYSGPHATQMVHGAAHFQGAAQQQQQQQQQYPAMQPPARTRITLQSVPQVQQQVLLQPQQQQVHSVALFQQPASSQPQFFWAGSSTNSSSTFRPHRYDVTKVAHGSGGGAPHSQGGASATSHSHHAYPGGDDTAEVSTRDEELHCASFIGRTDTAMPGPADTRRLPPIITSPKGKELQAEGALAGSKGRAVQVASYAVGPPSSSTPSATATPTVVGMGVGMGSTDKLAGVWLQAGAHDSALHAAASVVAQGARAAAAAVHKGSSAVATAAAGLTSFPVV